MKASPRFREGTAYVKMKHQPPHIKYPLVALHVVANIEVYDAKTLKIKDEVKTIKKSPQNNEFVSEQLGGCIKLIITC